MAECFEVRGYLMGADGEFALIPSLAEPNDLGMYLSMDAAYTRLRLWMDDQPHVAVPGGHIEQEGRIVAKVEHEWKDLTADGVRPLDRWYVSYPYLTPDGAQ